MNRPIDPREGNRRQKALRERLAQLVQGRKATVGRLGQSRGQVRSVGAIGGARGARFPGNGAARPGALNFLQNPGFGLRARDIGRGPEMIAEYGPPGLVRHASNPLPSKPLPSRGPQAIGGPTGPEMGPQAADNPGDPGYVAPNPDDPSGQIITEPSGRGAGFTSTAGALAAEQMGLIPLGGGAYYNPVTGVIQGSNANNAQSALAARSSALNARYGLG